jgi:hypothetical protein
LGAAVVAGVAFALVSMTSSANMAPSREDEATDELYGGQQAPREAPAKDVPAQEPPTEAPAPTDPPAVQPEPTTGRADDVKPTSSKAPTSDSALGPKDSDEVGGEEASDDRVETPSPEPDDAPPRDPARRSLSHHRQGSLTIMPGWGFSAIVPYQKRVFCGEFSDDPGSSTKRKSFCTMGSPWFIEFTGGYGVHPRLDVVLGVRLHVQKRDYRCRGDEIDSCKGLFNDSLAVGLAPGIRAWISDPERMFKIGGAVDFVWLHERFSGYRARARCEGRDDFVNGPCPVEEPLEGYEGSRDDETRIGDDDIGFRIGPVIQVDPHPNFGIFLMPAARMGLLRWFEFSFDIALGVQARFP